MGVFLAVSKVKLTAFSHGAGCGCKIAPRLLSEIVGHGGQQGQDFPDLVVGHASRDDAAVFDMGQGEAVISTTDFFMPVVDDPFDFGRIAATNAISDVYAMGGRPIMAVAILGWPIAQLGPEIAREVVAGGREGCRLAGMPLAGGHSIDAPEPVFGLAVTGRVPLAHLKRNDQAHPGDRLFLTKPLGVGILTTAEKRGQLKAEHGRLAVDTMCTLNKVGAALGSVAGVSAMTDVTGFGLCGHLLEMCEGSGVSARLREEDVPLLPGVDSYREQGCIPGGTGRNFDSYGDKLAALSECQRQLFCDPQTSGGLLVAVTPDSEQAFLAAARQEGVEPRCIGDLEAYEGTGPYIRIH